MFITTKSLTDRRMLDRGTFKYKRFFDDIIIFTYLLGYTI